MLYVMSIEGYYVGVSDIKETNKLAMLMIVVQMYVVS